MHNPGYVSKLEQDMRHIEELKELNSSIIASLARAIDAKDRYTRSHINRVQTYAVGLAEAAGLDGAELEAVRTGALVHDVGKLGVPERILGKPGKLTPEEFRRIQDHVTIGAEILSPVPFPYPVIPIVLTHHERWDGLGYPQGLRAEDIPIGGRIMAIADVFDALTSNRPYRTAMPIEEALRALEEDAGRRFDPNLVATFRQILPALHQQVVIAEAAEAEAALREEGENAAPDPVWAYNQISQAAAEMSATCELAQGLANTSSVREVVDVVLDRVLRLLPADAAVVYLCVEPEGELRAEEARGRHEEKLRGLVIAAGEGVSGWVAERMQPRVNVQAALDIARRFEPDEMMELSTATAVPLIYGGRTLGVLTLYTTAYSVVTAHHLGVLNVLAEHTAAAIVGARRYETTREQSLTDPLTGLSNSRALLQHLEQLCEEALQGPPGAEPTFAVVMFDLDGFKGVNDTHGHLSGDELLQVFATVLRRQCREADFCCRYAGDEFVLVASSGGSAA
ncbi:MAG: diguanylate cyclase, partial [Armatimonadetes bacterium]|nr:diguanylate cyclase [Armatimonadota bacterium]